MIIPIKMTKEAVVDTIARLERNGGAAALKKAEALKKKYSELLKK